MNIQRFMLLKNIHLSIDQCDAQNYYFKRYLRILTCCIGVTIEQDKAMVQFWFEDDLQFQK